MLRAVLAETIRSALVRFSVKMIIERVVADRVVVADAYVREFSMESRALVRRQQVIARDTQHGANLVNERYLSDGPRNARPLLPPPDDLASQRVGLARTGRGTEDGHT